MTTNIPALKVMTEPDRRSNLIYLLKSNHIDKCCKNQYAQLLIYDKTSCENLRDSDWLLIFDSLSSAGVLKKAIHIYFSIKNN